MERLLFYYFHVTSIPVHTLRSCGCRPIQKFQEQMKIKTSINAMKAERNDLALPAHIWLVFIFLKSSSDQIAHFCGCGRCSTEHRRLTTNEIEPAMISFKGNTISSKMANQTNMILLPKKTANLSLFSKSFKWMTSGHCGGNLY